MDEEHWLLVWNRYWRSFRSHSLWSLVRWSCLGFGLQINYCALCELFVNALRNSFLLIFMILIFKLGVRQKHRAITVLTLGSNSWAKESHPRMPESCHWNSGVAAAVAASLVGGQSCSRHSEKAGMVRRFLLLFDVSFAGCPFNYCESDHKPQFDSKSFKYILETAATKLPGHFE